MRVLVAGATGAIGRPLVEALAGSGHEVVAGSRSEQRAAELRRLGAEPVVLDALVEDSVERAVDAARPDAIVNQLTAIPKALNPRRIQQQFEATNRLRRVGTANLMAAAARHGVRRVVAQSIAFAYLPTGRGLWVETDDLATEFGEIIKAVADLERQTLNTESVEGIVLRYGFFYGPGTGYAAGDGAAAAEIRKRRFPIIGKGSGVWSFIHVDDAAAATVAALEHGAHGIYNVVDDEPAPMREWLPDVAAALGAKPPRRVPAWVARLAAGPVFAHYGTTLQGASNEKAKRGLGWQPSHPSWRQGVREAAG
jgi:nucleoside-diphosphate-sugar epimerase